MKRLTKAAEDALVKRIRGKFLWADDKVARALQPLLDEDLNLTTDTFTIRRTTYTGVTTDTIKRVEFPDGEVGRDVIYLPDGTVKVGRIDFPYGEIWYDVTNLPDGTEKVGRKETPQSART